MAGFLESLGAGLRHGGLALAAGSPEVFREQGRAIERRKERDSDRNAKVAETMLRAAHSGQIPPERLPDIQRAMAKLGYELPLEVLSPTPEAREKLLEYARGDVTRGETRTRETALENMYDTPPGLGIPGEGLRGPGPAPIPPVALAPPPPAAAGTPPGVQTFPLAERDRQMGVPVPGPGLTQDQQYEIGDIDAQSQAFGEDPAHPAEVIPPGAATAMPGEMGQLASMEINGRRPAPQGTIPPIVQTEPAAPVAVAPAQEPMVPSPIQGGGMIPRSLAERYKIIVQAANRGVPAAKEMLAKMLEEIQPKHNELKEYDLDKELRHSRTGELVRPGRGKSSALSDIGKLLSERQALAEANPNDPGIAEYDRAIGAVSHAKAGALSDLGKLTQERAAVAAANPNAPELAVYDRTIANYKQAANAKDDTFKNANVLRDEFNAQSKNFTAIAQARRQIIEAARDPTAAGDLSLLYGYMKSLDPNSVVRESEFAMAAQAGSLPSRIQGWATKLINGERLPDKIRTDFVNQSAKLYDAAVVDQKKLTERYRGIAERNNLPVEDIVGDFSTESRMGGAAPAAAKKTMTIKQGKDAGEYYQENGKWFKK